MESSRLTTWRKISPIVEVLLHWDTVLSSPDNWSMSVNGVPLPVSSLELTCTTSSIFPNIYISIVNERVN
jgi:hypothetical protein